jgi:hypothetical protein
MGLDASREDASDADAGRDSGSEFDSGSERDAGTTRQDGGGTPQDGATGPGPGSCTSNADCGAMQYCEKALEDCGGVGTCEWRPELCVGPVEHVCGCDGRTYSSPCLAASAGATIDHAGACEEALPCGLRPPPGCCFQDADCSSAGRCVNEDCAAEMAGTCVSDVLGRGECWEDADCPAGQPCVGATICPCGVPCILPDRPGTCGGGSES